MSRLGSLDTLLIKTVDEWDHCLREAVNFQFPKAFQLFSFILIFPNLINAREIYDKYKLYLSITSERNALKLINNTLPDISSELMEYNDDIEDDLCTHTPINEDELLKKIQSLNGCQHKIFTKISTAFHAIMK